MLLFILSILILYHLNINFLTESKTLIGSALGFHQTRVRICNTFNDLEPMLLEDHCSHAAFELKTIYSRLSLSRNRRAPLKHFEISALRHIRFVVLRKNNLNSQISHINM